MSPVSIPNASPEAPVLQRKLVADAGKLSGATAITHVINMAGGLVVARLLGPMLYGIWKSVQLAMEYTAFSNLGSINGLDRTCPGFVATGRLSAYRGLVNSSMLPTLLLSMLISLGFLWVALGMEDGPARLAMLALVILVMLQPPFQHAESGLAVEKRFGTKARILILSTSLRVGLSIVAAWLAGLAGVLLVYVIVMVWTAWAMWRGTRLRFSMRVEPRVWGRLLLLGFPITAMVIGERFLLTVDRWVVLSLLGPTEAGLYFMATFPMAILMFVPSALRQVVSIDVYDKWSRLKSLEPAREVHEKAILAIALGSPVMAGAIWFGLPWLVESFLPDYRRCIPPLQVYAVALFPVMICQTVLPVAVVARRVIMPVVAMVVLAGLSITGAIVAVSMGGGLMEVMFAHAVGWLLYGAVLLLLTESWMGEPLARSLPRVLGWLSPMVLLAVELPVVEWFVGDVVGLARYSLPHALAAGVLHLVVCSPMLMVLENRTGYVSYAMGAVRRKVGIQK
jgi:O-antigen/teichoic acid export membrane protein